MHLNVNFEKNNYLALYKYLPVLSAEQITKLRNIAVGILTLGAFSAEEINVLENKMNQSASDVVL
jgi:hypothetical protein